MLRDLGLLVLRLVTGGLLAGHGSQKLFGWFGGYGLAGTAGWLESLGLRPGRRWAPAAGAGEFGGGLLTALGLFHPLGPIVMMAPMATAIRRVHWGRPIWVTEGGAELPVTDMAAATTLLLTGPGGLSLDRLFGIRVPAWIAGLVAGATAVGIAMAVTEGPAAGPEAEQRAGREPAAGQEAPATPTGPLRPGS